MLAGLGAVAVDLGTAYLAKAADQRVADSAAYAGALAFNASSSTTTMNAAVGNLAILNGLAASAAVANLVASPSGNGNNAVRVTVSTSATLYLAGIFRTNTTLPVSATSYAEVKPGASTCILALRAGASGVTLSGGTSVTGANCSIASNSTVTVPCGTTITTKTLDYNSAAVPSQPCGGIKPPAGTASVNIVKVATPDPLASNAAIASAFTHVISVGSQSGPSGPTVAAGPDLSFAYKFDPTKAPLQQLNAAGCIGSTFVSPVWTVKCPPGGTYHFGNITMNGGITLSFAEGANGSATNTYDFSGSINVGGAAASFGAGTYNVAGGIITGGGTTTSFGTGTYNIGAGTASCSGSVYSICNFGTTLTFGAGAYTIAGGIYNTGGATLSIGAGSTANSFDIGPGSAGYAINTNTTATLGDMTSGTFRIVGNISNSGGSSLTLSAAPAHDLKGTITLAGSATLGSGVWTIAGNVSLGSAGGGGTVTGSGVSVITTGSFTVAAGYSNVTLTAPASGALQNVVVASNGSGGANFAEGASGNSLSGAFYFPSASITLSGAGNVGNGAGPCLEQIGSTITLSGGSALASTCAGLGGAAAGGSVALVQ
jgi:hypothetical protein